MPRKRQPGKRAPNGTSTIYYSEYDQKWHGRVTMGVRDDGKPDRRHVKRSTESEAIRAVRALEKERDSGRIRKPGKTWTLDQWLHHWYENIAGPTVRYKTRTYYQTAIFKYLIPGIGAHRLDKLEPEHIERLYARLRKEGAKSATLQQIHRTLRAALNEATRRERITRNPIAVVKSPPPVETEIEPLTLEDAQALLIAARSHRNGIRWAVALALGLRQGEAIGLQWTDIKVTWYHGCPDDMPCATAVPVSCPQRYPTGTATIRRALQRQTWQHGCDSDRPCGRKRGAECPGRHGGGLVIVEPKTRAGRRVVSLPAPLIAGLADHQAAQDVERQQAGSMWQEGGWVFAQPTGKPTDPRADYGEWKALLAEAGVREARLHDARHTTATMLLVLGVPGRAVMDVMGWSQANMRVRYQHVSNPMRDRIAEQVGGLLWAHTDAEDKGRESTTVPA